MFEFGSPDLFPRYPLGSFFGTPFEAIFIYFSLIFCDSSPICYIAWSKLKDKALFYIHHNVK